MTKLHINRQFKKMSLFATYKRGSGDASAIQFSPDSTLIASMHITKSDIYNEPGNFLICDIGLKGWSDGNPGISLNNQRYRTSNE